MTGVSFRKEVEIEARDREAGQMLPLSLSPNSISTKKDCPHAGGQSSPVGWIVVALGVDVKREEQAFFDLERKA